ncbi:hypothetical protein K388_05036 [Streptomyces sp. KhCrAH-43]|uniref:hypothetical protein n=1 Tax=unclassified Streptomyces TaxID=2593676 RepID=UPI00036424FA|nr:MULTISPECIES: hypothetical protein [unclassified Streptomyces]MYX67305.1 hypothetical protein [Streptomyces sp. SID8373]RAJ54902.1 hypothetical protein K388_05036 [Streptomyces sp. KhCrAH-43]
MTKPVTYRPAVRNLINLLRYRSSFGRPCYIKRNQQHAALIVPELRNGAEGPYAHLKTFDRATVHEAVVLGAVTLGPGLVDVPTFSGNRNHWAFEAAHQGRIIQLRQAAS